MRAIEILNEKHVESTWITDLIYTRPTRTLTMKLSNGKAYAIPGISRSQFERWYKSNSKGQFFHKFIKDSHQVKRIR